jgi:hypothetical protein
MCKRSFAIGRMYYAHPTSGERYYLRMLLNYVKGATSYEHLGIVDSGVCLQTIMNGIKPVFGPQDDSCMTCLPP